MSWILRTLTDIYFDRLDFGICVAGTGILAILIEIKVIELYKKNCWDVIDVVMRQLCNACTGIEEGSRD